MKTINKKEFLEKEKFYFKEIKKGKIFIYPTDTIYGIGCNAELPGSIEKIRAIKKRDTKPFSIIVPDKNWILNNCRLNKKDLGFVEKLPGKFTLILNLNESGKIAKKSLIGDLDSVGLRIPDNWFAKWLTKMNLIFVTTSVNLSGQKPLTKISEITAEIAEKIDYAIEDGILDNEPSKIINLTSKEPNVVNRHHLVFV
jgi:L-threonylcarbamoyladenylate synthase